MGVILKLVVIAEPDELKLIPEKMRKHPVLITGVGKKNIKRLPAIVGIDVYNYGYCGSNLPIGKTVRVGKKHRCITVDEFAETIPDGVGKNDVVDMELKYLQEQFPNVISHKTVSDHFDLYEHRRNI